MNAFEMTNLKMNYPGFDLNIDHLALPEGCILGLIGDNGAGKSTLIRSMLGLVKSESDRLKVMDCEVNSESFAEAKNHIGVVLGDAGLPLTLTAEDLGEICASAYRNWDNDQYYTYLTTFDVASGVRVRDLSLGMRSKLAIAIALSHHADFLILDEPSIGLDPVARDAFSGVLNDFTRDESHSVLISSHITSDLEKICDYIAILHKGKLKLFEEKDRLKEIYGIIAGPEALLVKIPENAVVGRSERQEVMVDKRELVKMPELLNQISPASLEDIFLFMHY